ncbi:hypothetical protein [Photobacterium frigidiphilum]|uniref:hypothetical protein n=1 Tax=Photobacterium frigidiphilum TaxID=264736 RepID=UPI003D10A3E0
MKKIKLSILAMVSMLGGGGLMQLNYLMILNGYQMQMNLFLLLKTRNLAVRFERIYKASLRHFVLLAPILTAVLGSGY